MRHSSLPRPALRSDDLFRGSFLAFLAIVALTGGTVITSSFGQVVVLGAATIAVAGWLIFGGREDRRLRPAIAFLGLCALVIGVQLVPLPPSWWEALPGRAAYVDAAAAGGVAGRWRPISVAPDLGWSAFFALLVPAAMLAGLCHMTGRRRAELLLPLAVLIFASGVLGLAQVSGGADSALRWYAYTSDSSAVGFLANRNHQALLLACALPVLAALASLPAVPGQRPGGRIGAHWVALGVAAFVILMLPATGSRAGLVLGGVALLLSLAIAAPAARRRFVALRRRQRRLFLAGGAGVALAFVALLVFLGRNVAFTRFATLDAMNDQRVRALPVVVDMTRDFLPLGSGFGTFDRVFRQFEPFELLKLTYFNQAHNDMLQLALEGGVPALLVLAGFVIWWLFATVRAWRAPASVQALAARAGSGVTLLCMLASFVDYPLRTPLMLAVFTLAAVWMLTPLPARSETADRR